MRIAFCCQKFLCQRIEFDCRFIIHRFDAFAGKKGAFFDGQLVEREMFQAEFAYLVQFLFPGFRGLSGPGVNQVGRVVVKQPCYFVNDVECPA